MVMTNEKAGSEGGCIRQKLYGEVREHKHCTHLVCLLGSEKYWKGKGH